MNRILGIGNALVDVIVHIGDEKLISHFGLKKGGMEMIDQERRRNIHIAIENYRKTIVTGGSTANTMHGLARLGVPVGYIGKIFDDEFGRFFRDDMISGNINPHFVFSENEDTGIATTLITDDGERTFATCLGAAATLTPAELDPNLFAGYNFVHVEGYLIFNHDLILRICQLAKECGATISMDMASYNVVMLNLDFMRDLLKNYVDIIFANEEEAKAFTGKEEHEALEILSDYCSTAIVKLGAHGSIAKQQGTVTVIPAIEANCIDSTGAGDIYASGFLYGLMNGLPVEKCGYIASRLAAELVETTGAKLSDAQWQKIRAKALTFNILHQ